jgi:hypothetical protein
MTSITAEPRVVLFSPTNLKDPACFKLATKVPTNHGTLQVLHQTERSTIVPHTSSYVPAHHATSTQEAHIVHPQSL